MESLFKKQPIYYDIPDTERNKNRLSCRPLVTKLNWDFFQAGKGLKEKYNLDYCWITSDGIVAMKKNAESKPVYITDRNRIMDINSDPNKFFK